MKTVTLFATKKAALAAVGSLSDTSKMPGKSWGINADLQQLRIAGSLGMTRDYVAAWCRLNHLMEC